MKINEQQRFKIMNEYEEALYEENMFNIIGIDEVGRGPIAGPVVIAGVILNAQKPILGLNDSKKLSFKKKLELDKQIRTQAIYYNICEISAKEIDEIGIANAIRKGVYQIIQKTQQLITLEHILIDYMKIDLPLKHTILKKGDQKSNSIAAASIIAKVYRDNLMIKLAQKYPQYSLDTNMGYGTKAHITAIKEHNIIKELHRESFEPIKTIVGDKK